MSRFLRHSVLTTLVGVVGSSLVACGNPQNSSTIESNSQASVEDGSDAEGADGTGTLQIRANGEDFVRQGFVTKDGWQVDFDHLYVSLAEVVAYQTDPVFDPDGDLDLQAIAEIPFDRPYIIDLAAGDENAEPVFVDEAQGAEGHYNALTWKMVPAAQGPIEGQVFQLQGQAQKGERTIDFTLRIDREYAYQCGEFVGDERKGILAAEDVADLELTFHFDHIFGDADLAADDALNEDALGFDPLAVLAEDDQFVMDWTTLEQKLAPEEVQILSNALLGLGHVGEGHCRAEQIS